LELSVRILLATLLIALALPAAAGAARGDCVAGAAGPTCKVWKGKVTFVDDGDTLEVDVAGDGTRRARRVRITGIQSMEMTRYRRSRRSGACHAVEAAERLEALIGGRRVRLAAQHASSRSRGRLQRTLAVRSGGSWRDAGSVLVSEGLALWWPSRREWAPNRSYAALARTALNARLGLFAAGGCGTGPAPAAPLKLWLNWDADGDDHANPSGEWVRVRNLDPAVTVPLAGWHIRDSALREYDFPAGAAIPPGGTVTVRVGRARAGELGWGMGRPVFENAHGGERVLGDGAYLFDPLGNVRAAMIYPCVGTGCSDPAQGALRLTAQPRGRDETITLTNTAAGAIALDGYILRSPPQSYTLDGLVLPAGGALRLHVGGDPADDTPLERHWGFPSGILNDGGDLVRLSTYDDIGIACTAWGDRSC
jgi:endonuclease YncB( thermonuclease family)